MDCETIQEALSARLDGEEAPVSAAEVSAHVARCRRCRQWAETAHRLNRKVRVSAALPIPERTEDILAAAAFRPGHRDPAAAVRRLRAALLLVAAGQAAVAAGALLALGSAPGHQHAARELGAFSLALAVGYAVAALRPRADRGLIWVTGVAAFALLATAAFDLAIGHTTAAHEARHLLPLTGWLLLWRLGRASPPSPPPFTGAPPYRPLGRRRTAKRRAAHGGTEHLHRPYRAPHRRPRRGQGSRGSRVPAGHTRERA